MNNNTQYFFSFLIALVFLVPSVSNANVLYTLHSHVASRSFTNGIPDPSYDIDLVVDSPTFLSSYQDSHFDKFHIASCTVTDPRMECSSLNVQVNNYTPVFFINRGALPPDTVELYLSLSYGQGGGLSQSLLFPKIALSNVGLYSSLNLNEAYLQVSQSSVPLPASIWFLGSGIIGLAGFARRKN